MMKDGLPGSRGSWLRAASICGTVVAVDLPDRPAEERKLLGERLELDDIFHVPEGLHAVIVHDGGQVVELVLGGEHDGLPRRPLVAIAVAHQAEDAMRGPGVPAARAIPTATGRPWPSEPVENSTPGT